MSGRRKRPRSGGGADAPRQPKSVKRMTRSMVAAARKRAPWGAENSHLVAGSLWGPNDELSAPPASVHQNTEWLAMEEGLKHLSGRDDLGGELRFKVTGYVHEQGAHKGTLQAARMKIYIGGKKVFDRISDGARGNIDSDESKALKAQVSGLRGSSAAVNPAHSRHHGSFFPSPKGVWGSTPSLAEVKGASSKRLSSVQSPMFTGIRKSTSDKRLVGAAAAKHQRSLYK